MKEKATCRTCMIKKSSRVKIAIVGATGLVGRTIAKVLTEQNTKAEYFLYNRSGGVSIYINGQGYTTIALTEKNIKANKVDYALFSAGGEISKEFAPMFVEMGAIVVDNSSAFRRDENVALIVPECGFRKTPIIANPNCTTIGAVVALKPLDDVFGLKRVTYSTYQAISGAGANPKFLYPIDNNVIPYIDGEEEKMMFETNKILRGDGHNGGIEVFATCIRVPVVNCHTISIHAEFERELTQLEVYEILYKARGVVVCGDNELPMPLFANDKDSVFVGRIRAKGKSVDMVVCLDNIRKGAATNAVQILNSLLSER